MAPGLSLALIGNASGSNVLEGKKCTRGVFSPQLKLVVSTFNSDPVRHDFKVTLLALMAGVTMLLFIACSNVTNLLLARPQPEKRKL
jgi:hypothetical protein